MKTGKKSLKMGSGKASGFIKGAKLNRFIEVAAAYKKGFRPGKAKNNPFRGIV